MQVININDVDIFVTEIPNESSSRRSNERMAVSELLGEAIPGASLGHHLNGAPFIHERPELCVSVSHSQSHAVLVISKRNIGIDIESPRQQLQRVANRVLCPDELTAFSALADGLLRAWTAKEAVFKCAGLAEVDFANEIHISTDGSASLRNQNFTLHWHHIDSQLICLAIPE
jgi:phosphopantetheinyl transferase